MKGKSRLEVAATLKDMASKGIQKVAASGKKIAGKVWTVTLKAVDLVTSPFKKVLGMISSPIAQAATFAGITLGLGDTVHTFMDFEAAMSQVSAVSGASGTELEKLTEKAREMGATTKFTSTEAAEAFNYMAMAGWKTGDMLNGIDGVLNLAAASNEDLATTSDIVTDAMTAFGMKANEASHFADVMAAASSSANTNVGLMGETFKYVAPVAGAMGYSIEDSAIAIGLMANNGIKASQGGTALRSIISRLSTDAGASSRKLGALGTLTQKLGVQFYKADGSARALNDILVDSRSAWQGLSKQQQINYAKTIAGEEAMSGWLALMNAAPSDIEKVTAAIKNCDGVAKDMADTMMDNLKGSLTKLQSAVGGLKESFGERLSPYVRGMVDWIALQIPAVENAIDDFMDTVDEKIAGLKTKFAEISAGPEWQNADFFGKVKIAWDEIIAQPFAEWWQTSGKEKIANVASNMGEGLGTGLKSGILTLLGVDAGGAVADGVDIGKSFADGFLEGFDGEKVGKAIWQAIKGGTKSLISDAATLLPGGEKASGTSLLSAGALGVGFAKLGGFKLLGGLAKGAGGTLGKIFPGKSGAFEKISDLLGSSSCSTMTVNAGIVYLNSGLSSNGPSIDPSLFSNGKKLLPGGTSTAAGPAIDPSLLPGGQKLLPGGTGTAAKAGPLGFFSKIGAKLGSGAATAGGTAAVGAAASAGAVFGGLGIFSGLKDIFKSFKAQDRKKKSDLRWGGGTKLGMVGAGAGAGAAIGSAVPVLGTAAGALIGAGVGGIGALWKGSSLGKKLRDLLFPEKAADSAFKAPANTGRYDSTTPDDINSSGLGEKIRNTLSETLFNGTWWGEKWNFVTQSAPQIIAAGLGTAKGFLDETLFSGEWWGSKWDSAVSWGKDKSEKISAWWSENISEKLFSGEWWISKWNNAVSWGKENGGKIADWWKENISGKLFNKDWWSSKWSNVRDWGKGILSEISSWWGDMTSAYAEGKEKGAGIATPHAEGGIMTRPHIGLVAEDGAEAIIPLSGKRRNRGITLWQEAGERLGVKPYAEGGFAGDTARAVPVTASGSAADSGTGISVTIQNVIFEINVNGGNMPDTQALVEMIRQNIRSLTDEIAYQLAVSIQQVYANKPTVA